MERFLMMGKPQAKVSALMVESQPSRHSLMIQKQETTSLMKLKLKLKMTTILMEMPIQQVFQLVQRERLPR
ncbi:hypothetical protein B2G88_11690 [Natronolimnobius baerhuensis]|uniref:Uncharacterized protein n=1 Tax=Natronolimnobius baerhuensis TaxID=253108 RepID=A0A202E9W7_9EURY|nr:hypothetical protein B2G88_11690 [Natronolimnobius baerhuensis]